MMTIFVVVLSADEAWEPIKYLKASYITDIAEFAVKTYNSQVPKKELKLVSVDKGEHQVVDMTTAINYRLTITTTESDANKIGRQHYQVIVYQNLTDFKPTKKLISCLPLQ
ncbi:Cysteine proteinase inhibitor 1 [Linum grandiflorum]